MKLYIKRGPRLKNRRVLHSQIINWEEFEYYTYSIVGMIDINRKVRCPADGRETAWVLHGLGRGT